MIVIHDQEAEWGVISSLMIDPTLVDEARNVLSADDFFDQIAGVMFNEICWFRANGKRFNKTTLLHRVKTNHPGIYSATTRASIDEFLESVPTASQYQYFESIVLNRSIQRTIQFTAWEAIRNVRDSNPVEQVNQIVSRLMSTTGRAHRDKPVSMATILQDALEAQTKRLERRGLVGVSTGFTDIDEFTSGLPPELIVLAARPSVGKTSLAMQIAVNVSMQSPVLFVSLEMTTIELADRILSWRAKAPLYAMRSGTLTQEHRRSIVEVSNNLNSSQLQIVDTSRMSANAIMAQAMKMKRHAGLGLIVIDYLELIEANRRESSRERELAEICGSLKMLQKEAGCPVICLAQLNRRVEEGADRDPKLSDLRGSGSIEQDAHQVWFLTRRIVAQQPGDDRIAKMLIAKNRNGRTGSLRLGFSPDHSSFFQLAQGERQKEF